MIFSKNQKTTFATRSQDKTAQTPAKQLISSGEQMFVHQTRTKYAGQEFSLGFQCFVGVHCEADCPAIG